MGSEKQKFPFQKAVGIATNIVGAGMLLAAPIAGFGAAQETIDKGAELFTPPAEEEMSFQEKLPLLLLVGGILVTASGCRIIQLSKETDDETPASTNQPAFIGPLEPEAPLAPVIALRPKPPIELPTEKTITA